MPRKLKVFRTPIGFHDAFVAAPSRKAALEAWGAEANLFARGLAEEIDDPALMQEPLERPGQVIKRLRGTIDEHLAALPTASRRKSAASPAAKSSSRRPQPSAVRQPRPTRDELNAAEEALVRAGEEHEVTVRKLDIREQALALERKKIERDHAIAKRTLEEARDDALHRYETAVRKWQAS